MKINLYDMMTRNEYNDKAIKIIKSNLKININKILMERNKIYKNSMDKKDIISFFNETCNQLNAVLENFRNEIKSLEIDNFGIMALFDNEFDENEQFFLEDFSFMVNEVLNIAVLIQPLWFKKLGVMDNEYK